MKLRSFRVSLFVCLSVLLFGSRVASAQQVQPLEPEWLRRMYDEGWQKVQEGVLQRNGEEGQIETFSYGAEGLQWVVEHHEGQLALFEEQYSESPNQDLAALIEELRERIERLRTNLVTASSAETFDGEGLNACISSYDAMATVGPQRSPRGVMATATAFFNSSDCGYEGHTAATAYANAIEGTLQTTKTQSDPKSSNEANGFAGITSFASATAEGSTDCDSYAAASVNVPGLEIDYLAEPPRNYSCPPDIAASITGPALVGTDFYTSRCADVIWTANPTGGTPSYTYQWYIGSSLAGSGPTLTKSYCEVNTTVDVKVVVSDQKQWSTEANFVTEIRHTPPVTVSINGLDRVDTNSTTPCMDVTWSANATGGHPGYTYTWYTGTGTTAEGTGSTFVKRYCNTTELVTAKVVARDSDGHTTEATKQTNIVHTAPVLAAAISGPAKVTTDHYTSACTYVTWTASATDGTPSYTYQWYIGSSPEGTGSSTLTKQYCYIDTMVNVKVVVRDQNQRSAEATFVTEIQHTDPLTASANGPDRADTNVATPCVDVTWSANAKDGHPGYTYKWYTGSGTTVEGTGSTFTKPYCNTTALVTAKVVVSDSDGHTAVVTKQTNIVHTAPSDPLAVTISGPTAIVLYIGDCLDPIWTASATGGASGYTYSWYIGTTLVGTGTSYTNRYCQPRRDEPDYTVTLKVVARDSAGATAQATHTATVY